MTYDGETFKPGDLVCNIITKAAYNVATDTACEAMLALEEFQKKVDISRIDCAMEIFRAITNASDFRDDKVLTSRNRLSIIIAWKALSFYRDLKIATDISTCDLIPIMDVLNDKEKS